MSTVTTAVTSEPALAAGPSRPRLDWRLRFGALSLIWGFSFLFIKVGTEGYAPFQVTLGRLVFGTAVLAAAMAVKRQRLPRGARTWGHLAVAAFLLNALPFSLFAYAELTAGPPARRSGSRAVRARPTTRASRSPAPAPAA
ncbi:EamA family transporter, partial [Streptomyces sp. NPDC002172]